MLKCKVCGKPDPKHLLHCEEHYKCDDCGAREDLCTRTDELTCGKCHKIRAAKQVAKYAGNTCATAEITCPWCGHELCDSWDHWSSGAKKCGNCDNEYTYESEQEVTYSSSKVIR